jgi:hypothetical protein
MIKSSLLVLTLLVGFAANASEPFLGSFHSYDMDPMALINWKVGDSSDYNIIAVFGNVGNMHKEVTKEEGTGVWLVETVKAGGQNDKSEVLIDRNTGKTLKLIHNGKEEAVPTEQPEIISQDYTSVTVPAGTFKVMHVVAKTKEVSKVELWINNVDIVIDGAAKQVVATQYGDVSLELTKQNKMH